MADVTIAPDISALPSELVELVIRQFSARRHRASLVCKRWRRIALRCITELTLEERHLCDPNATAILAQVSSLTSLTIRAAPDPAPAGPMQLTRLVCSLRTLRLPLRTETTALLLSHSSSSLVSLTIDATQSSTSTLDAVMGHSLPSLSSLHLETEHCFGGAVALIAQHESKLISLGLGCAHTDDNVYHLRLPRYH